MAKAFLYWFLVAVALFVVGPIAGPLVGDLRAPDGLGHVTPLTAAHPLTGLAHAALAFLLALVIGSIGSWIFGAREGMTLSGLVLAWCAFQSGAPDEILRRTQDSGILWRFSLEGAILGLLGLALALALLRAGRHHRPDHTADNDNPPDAPSHPTLGLLAGIGAGMVVAAVIAWMLAFETLKMQTIFAAGLAGVGAGAAAQLAGSAIASPAPSPARTALAAFVAMALLSVVGPVSALAAASGAGGLLRSAHGGGYFSLAAPLALDWIAGALLGVPMGLAWSGAMLEKGQA